MAEDEDGLGSG